MSPASFFVHLASSAVTPTGSVKKSRGYQHGASVGAVEEMMCVVCASVTGGGVIVVMDVIWRRFCVNMI